MNIFIKAHKMGCLPFYEFHDTIYYLITFFPLSRPFSLTTFIYYKYIATTRSCL